MVNEFVERLADYKQQLEEEKKNEKDDKKRANNAHHTPVATVAAEDTTQDVDDDEVRVINKGDDDDDVNNNISKSNGIAPRSPTAQSLAKDMIFGIASTNCKYILALKDELELHAEVDLIGKSKDGAEGCV